MPTHQETGFKTMTKTLKCISPIDGSTYLERPVLSRTDANTVVNAARIAVCTEKPMTPWLY